MFIDDEYKCKIYAKLDNSIISGTLKNCEIIPALLNVIRDTNDFLRMYDDASKVLNHDFSDSNPKWESEEMMLYIEELFYIMCLHAPDGYYFGMRLGDGADFGYWSCSEDE